MQKDELSEYLRGYDCVERLRKELSVLIQLKTLRNQSSNMENTNQNNNMNSNNKNICEMEKAKI